MTRHTHTATIEHGAYELETTFSFTVAWGTPETGRGYMADPANYDPGSGDVVEDIAIVEVEGCPWPCEAFEYSAEELGPVLMAYAESEKGQEELLATALEDEADNAADAAERQAEMRAEDREMGW